MCIIYIAPGIHYVFLFRGPIIEESTPASRERQYNPPIVYGKNWKKVDKLDLELFPSFRTSMYT